MGVDSRSLFSFSSNKQQTLEGIPTINEPVVIANGFLVPLRRSMRERGKEDQGHQDVNCILAGLGY